MQVECCPLHRAQLDDVRRQFAHVIDVAATILDAAGTAAAK